MPIKIGGASLLSRDKRLATTDLDRRLLLMVFWKPGIHIILVADQSPIADWFHQDFATEIFQPCCNILATDC